MNLAVLGARLVLCFAGPLKCACTLSDALENEVHQPSCTTTLAAQGSSTGTFGPIEQAERLGDILTAAVGIEKQAQKGHLPPCSERERPSR